jgi:major intracellular serine protease
MKDLLKLILLAILLAGISFFIGDTVAKAETIRVAVIDTGFDFDSKWSNSNLDKPKLCKDGHKDFTKTSVKDNHGHGTHIASLIAKGNKDIDYCLVILKFFNKEPTEPTLLAEIKALTYAINLKVDIINLSLSGNVHSRLECFLISKALDMGIKVVVAAGNEGINISRGKSYPAMCDKRIKVVINGENVRNISSTSNFFNGNNAFFINGEDILGLGLNNSELTLSGTSQSAALLTSKLLRK